MRVASLVPARLAPTLRSFAHVISALDPLTVEVEHFQSKLKDAINSFSEHGSLPESILAAKERCEARYKELEPLLDKSAENGKKRHTRGGNWILKARRWIKAMATEQERRGAYYAFRDSVLHLIDLASS